MSEEPTFVNDYSFSYGEPRPLWTAFILPLVFFIPGVLAGMWLGGLIW